MNFRLVEIYHVLKRLQELADAVMYSPLVNNEIKELFLNWYESKLRCLKDEIWEYTENI